MTIKVWHLAAAVGLAALLMTLLAGYSLGSRGSGGSTKPKTVIVNHTITVIKKVPAKHARKRVNTHERRVQEPTRPVQPIPAGLNPIAKLGSIFRTQL